MSHNVVCKDITETSTYCAPSAKRHCSDAAHISCPCTYSSICPIINLSIIHPPFHPSTHPSIQLSIHLFTHGCLCTGSSLLGRAKQLGPHSFVHLSLFPANDQLEVALPPLQTPFQAQTFCPEFHFRRQLPLQIDARMVRELATQVEQLAACCRHLSLLWASAAVTSPTAPCALAESLPQSVMSVVPLPHSCLMFLMVDCTQANKLCRVIPMSAGIVTFVPYAACCAHCTVYCNNIACHAVHIVQCDLTT